MGFGVVMINIHCHVVSPCRVELLHKNINLSHKFLTNPYFQDATQPGRRSITIMCILCNNLVICSNKYR